MALRFHFASADVALVAALLVPYSFKVRFDDLKCTIAVAAVESAVMVMEVAQCPELCPICWWTELGSAPTSGTG